MTSLVFFTVLVALVAVERLVELVISNRNAAWSLERGGRETGRAHYTVMVVLHTGLLAGMLVEAWVRRPEVPALLAGVMLALTVASQGLRWWCIATLGRRWNTRVIVVPDLPLVHAAWVTAVVFTVANAALLRVRLRVENDALATVASGQH